MPPINAKKKIDKLNQFVKVSDRVVYYKMFHSLVLKASYNYIDIEDDIKNLIKIHFNANCDIHYLGSRVIGLGYKSESDLDLFIDIGKRYYKNRNYNKDVNIVEHLKTIFDDMPKEWTFKKLNYSVPSIKAIHIKSGIKCDISVTNGLAVHNSQLLGHLFDLQPECVALFHYLKKWLKCFDVRFKGFSLTLMLIFYMQNNRLLPSIWEVQQGVYPEIFIDKYAVHFDSSRNRDYYGITEITNFKEHLKGFFDFYSHYNYRDYIICTFSGRSIRKDCYVERIESNTPVTIAAPLLRRTNCAKYITNLHLVEFIEACDFSVKYLKEYKLPQPANDFEFFN
ncbi:terminal uridylyltransferase Tailor-like [Chironomus tepperi]|uniref:terminal uridylyltransferase Tailor-like n=1 Tax=Chironomus tepperi TaxID=113505 RepID=UPI00391F6F70